MQSVANKILNTDNYDIRDALKPDTSVFVSANAGAGKTSLLTDRVLSLLLHGIYPSKILCLTYTKAAATEMSNRVLEKLGKWVMADQEALHKELSRLVIGTVPNHLIERARGLFATVLEAPEGIRFQTLHSFSQSLLRRFPLEANVSPHFSVMDTGTQNELLKEASMRLFAIAQTEDLKLQHSLRVIAGDISESSIKELLNYIINEKAQFASLFQTAGGIDSATLRIYSQLKLKPDDTVEALIERHFTYDDATLATLRSAITHLMQGTPKRDQKTATKIAQWLETPANKRIDILATYLDAFLKKDFDKRSASTLFNEKALNESEKEVILAEQNRVANYYNNYKALKVAQNSCHMLVVAHALLGIYDALKVAHVQMDYDDLILMARNLLRKPDIAPWILFKLDGGVDHVLIDEAQDTSPLQWEIVRALTNDFFDGMGRSDTDRSLFVVGDEKQSIFSFQGADPVALGMMQNYFTQKIEDAGMTVRNLSRLNSYRSTHEVLHTVDTIFANEEVRRGLTFDGRALQHIVTRTGHAGLVELWPIIGKEDASDDSDSDEDDEDNNAPNVSKLAWRIADQIEEWLDKGLWLESKKRCAHAGDIMILVRTRTKLVDRLVSALKRRGVAVAGLDRMKLGSNLVVQDFIALGNVLLLPEDDLTLAALLKSPIFNLSEDALYTLAWGRGKATLWQRLREMGDKPEFKDAYDMMMDLRSKADFISPYELYNYLLDSLGARMRIIGRMGSEYNDPIDEFLGQALLYERSHVPSMQGFIHWMSSSETEIKRDMEQVKNAVRILTVHASKGLQAPIVILPDTKPQSRDKSPLLWHEQENQPALPLWPRRAEDQDEYCKKLRAQNKEEASFEYRRQLYVALTRAEDQLYICGHHSFKKISEQSWYYYIQQGLQNIATPFDTPWGEQGLRVGQPAEFRPEAIAKQAEPQPEASLPSRFDFIKSLPPREPTPPQPLVPSRMQSDEPATASPLDEAGTLYQRGTLIHRLLQYLPDINVKKRVQAAQNIASVYKQSLTDEVRIHCIEEVLRIIAHEPFDFLFGEGSLAEAPIAGCADIGGKQVAIAGQIDRLHVGNDAVWVVDFKSGRNVPANDAEIPAHYIRQLRLYQLLLQQLYPQKQVYCGILWTATPKLTPLPQALLDEVDLSTYI